MQHLKKSHAYQFSKMWIDGKCFTIDFQKINKCCKQPISSSINYDCVLNENGTIYTSFQLPTFYCKELLKLRDLDIIKLEKYTNTKIEIPVVGKIKITGNSEENIAFVRDIIQSATIGIRKLAKPLQFISIPISNDEIKSNFNKFRDNILSTNDTIEGMEESIFINPQKLHLTIAVMALFDQREINKAVECLNNYKENVLKPILEKTGPLTLTVSGLECMDNNYKKANVLYANALIENETIEEVTLQSIVDEMALFFCNEGFLKEEKSNVKLHMTLINTKYRKKSSNANQKRRWVKKVPFDASFIMDTYKDFYFGKCQFESVHISLMSSIGPDGYYESVAKINV